MVRSLGADWTSHLFGAGGANRPLRFMEAQAGFVERKVQIVEQTSDFWFRIGNQLLVDNSMNRTGRDCVEVAQQAHVISIIPAEMLKVVGEFLAPREMLFEVRETARE